MQQPYEFGYQSMIKMAEVHRGRQVGRAGEQAEIIPTKMIDKSNVAEFAATMQRAAEEVELIDARWLPLRFRACPAVV